MIPEENVSVRRIGFCFLAAGVVLCAAASTRAEEKPSSTFRETATVTVVEVPVVVLRGSDPVRDLTAGDFALLLDGVEQTIEGFEQVDLSIERFANRSPSEQPVSLAGRRYFLLAFDLSHTQPADAHRAVKAARELVDRGLHDSDLVGVSIYGAAAGARLLHPFTSNRIELVSALLAVEAVISRDPEGIELARTTLEATGGSSAEDLVGFLEEIRTFAAQQGVGLGSTTGPAGEWLTGFDGSGWGSVMTETLAQMEAFHRENTIYITRDRALDLLETLADLATALEEVRGQKYFVLFSEGIDQSFFEDFSNSQGSRRLFEALRSFRRSGWIMHAVNVARGTGVERGMFALVSATDGREYRDFNRLDEAMGQMLEQTSVSYVLSFQPEGLAHDGGYHEIEVRLRQHKDARVRHRDGFFAPRATHPLAEEDYLVAVADRVASEREGGPLRVAAIAVPFRDTGATARVRAVVEIDGPDLLQDQQGDLLPLEIETYLLDPDVGAVSLSTRKVTLDVSSQGELVRGGGVKILQEHLLGAGEHQLRVAVIDRGNGRRSLVTVPVVVPDFRTPRARVLEPFFPELSRSWLVVRETEQAVGSPDQSPFQFGGRRFVPRADVSLQPGQVVPVVAMGFDLAESSPRLRVELVSEDGTRPDSGSLVMMTEPERTEDKLYRVMAELDTTGLAPGRYEIRVSHGGGSADPDTSSSRFFEIR